MSREESTPGASETRFALGLFAFSLFTFMLLVPMGPPVILDDGYYYLQIAKNVAAGRGSTFDGLSPTNGYHPLWMLTLVPLFWILATPETAITAALILQAALGSTAVVLLYRTARMTLSRTAATAVALSWSIAWYRLILSGLEVSLCAVLVLATLSFYLQRFRARNGEPQDPQAGQYLRLGFLASLAFLTRVDNAFLILSLAGALIRRQAHLRLQPRAVRRLLAFIAPTVVLCGGYLFFNARVFGSFLPISGVVKAAWSERLLQQDLRDTDGGSWATWKTKTRNLLWPLEDLRHPNTMLVLLGSAGGLVLLVVGARWSRSSTHSRFSWRGVVAEWRFFLAAAFLQYVAYGIFFHGRVTYGFPWYYVTPTIAGVLILGLGMDAVRFGVGRRFEPTARLLVLGVLGGLALSRANAEIRSVTRRDRAQENGFRWIRENLPADAVIGSWNAGALGFWSGRTVVNLDGLVNTDNFHFSHRERLCTYWDEIGLDYVADVMDLQRGPAAPLPLRYTFADCTDRLAQLVEFKAPSVHRGFRVFRYLPPGETNERRGIGASSAHAR